MIKKDTLPRYVSSLPHTETFGMANDENKGQIFDLRGIDLLDEPNREVARTIGIHVNGDSSMRHLKPDRILVVPPLPYPPQESFIILQKWEGYVLEIGQDTFLARLVPIEGQGPDQVAEIYLDEVDEADRELMELGAVFYWTIGYLRRPSGTKVRSSWIRFQRLSAWTEQSHVQAEDMAGKIRDLFDDGK